MSKIELYTTPYCGFCRQAKALLNNEGVPFKEIDVSDDQNLRAQVSKQYDWKTVPIIVIGGQLIGGCTELIKIHRSGELKRMLEQD